MKQPILMDTEDIIINIEKNVINDKYDAILFQVFFRFHVFTEDHKIIKDFWVHRKMNLCGIVEIIVESTNLSNPILYSCCGEPDAFL